MEKSKPIHKPSLPFPQLTQSYLIKPSNITLIYRTLRGQSPWGATSNTDSGQMTQFIQSTDCKERERNKREKEIDRETERTYKSYL